MVDEAIVTKRTFDDLLWQEELFLEQRAKAGWLANEDKKGGRNELGIHCA